MRQSELVSGRTLGPPRRGPKASGPVGAAARTSRRTRPAHSPNNRKVSRRKNRVFFRGCGGHFPLAGRLVVLGRCWLLLVRLCSAATTWSQHVGMGHRSSPNRPARPPALEHRHHGGSSRRLGGPQAVARSALSYGAHLCTYKCSAARGTRRLSLSRHCGRPDADKAHRARTPVFTASLHWCAAAF
jgi:hypothetical protein